MRYITKIRRGYGLSAVRNEKELKAIVQFCKEELTWKHKCDFLTNTMHCWVFLLTVKLYNEMLENNTRYKFKPDTEKLLSIKKFNLLSRPYVDVYDFIDDHVGYYWS